MTDKVKERIQSLCPDTMELKLGCEVEILWARERTRNTIFRCYLNGEIDSVDALNKVWSINPKNDKTPQISKILGSPITLAVVLRAIEKHNRETDIKFSHIALSVYGEFYNSDEGKLLANWNLLRDYEDQTEETQKLIGTLLGVV